MLITCKNLKDLPSFSQIQLVAGAQGENRAVTWPYVNQTLNITPWIHGGELVFVTGMEANYTTEVLLTFFRDCFNAGVAGVVILCHEDYIQNLPNCLLEEANNLALPLFEMPWTLKIVDVTKEIANTIIQTGRKEDIVGDFFYELLFSEKTDISVLQRLANQMEIGLDSPAFVGIFSFFYKDNDTSYHESPQLHLLQHGISDVLTQDVLILPRGGQLICYVPLGEKSIKENLISKLTKHLELYQKSHNIPYIRGGIGGTTFGERSVRNSYIEAVRSFQATNTGAQPVLVKNWDDFRVLQMIPSGDNLPNIITFCKETLGIFQSSDKEFSSSYILTLREYLSCGGNLKQTAEVLFIHRNTLVYRLEKMSELSGKKLTDLEYRVDLSIALKVADFYEIWNYL